MCTSISFSLKISADILFSLSRLFSMSVRLRLTLFFILLFSNLPTTTKLVTLSFLTYFKNHFSTSYPTYSQSRAPFSCGGWLEWCSEQCTAVIQMLGLWVCMCVFKQEEQWCWVGGAMRAMVSSDLSDSWPWGRQGCGTSCHRPLPSDLPSHLLGGKASALNTGKLLSSAALVALACMLRWKRYVFNLFLILRGVRISSCPRLPCYLSVGTFWWLKFPLYMAPKHRAMVPACSLGHRDVKKGSALSCAWESQQQKQLPSTVPESEGPGEPAFAAGQRAQKP